MLKQKEEEANKKVDAVILSLNPCFKDGFHLTESLPHPGQEMVGEKIL